MKSLAHCYFYMIGLLLVFGCKEEINPTTSLMESNLMEVKNKYAPDKRVALFDVEAEKINDKYVLKGESNLPEAIADLKSRLVRDSIVFEDTISMLPSASLGNETKAIVTISVANLRSNPGHSSELATQATLGTVLNVLKKKDEWYLVQTPDRYIAWVDEGGISLTDTQKVINWNRDEKIIYAQTYGHAYAQPLFGAPIVSDLTAGNLLRVLEIGETHYAVRFPDGRNGFVIKSEAEPYTDWLENLNATNETLVSTGERLMGVPYLWGGTSTKGVDCSGFTKTIYFLNGMVIPRDASQQVHTGISIDSIGSFDNLERGDLLFFGKKATDSTKEKVVHVGMWIGDDQFIHSSGKVRISSVDRNDVLFDEYNLNRYLRTKRVFKQKGEGLIDLTETFVSNN